jgi:hypothetical protein
MSKIRLDVDTLHVETFEPEPREAVLHGTVHAHAYSERCLVTETRAVQLTTCDATNAGCRTAFQITCSGCEPTPTAACATQDFNDDTCGLSCVRCVINPTRQLIQCTTTD